MANTSEGVSKRLQSLDFFRGFTMFLLIAEFAGIFHHLRSPELEGSFLYWLGTQLDHVEWEGLHFWDNIQPFFMYIVGVAMPLSFARRGSSGQDDSQIKWHVYKRAFLLLFLGWALYCIDPGKIVFRFQNVLAQLAVTYLIAYWLMRSRFVVQVLASLTLLLITEILYRTFPIAGFDHAFVPGQNFGAWFNILIAGEEDGGHWAMFNAIPTAAHTIWGVLTGQLLLGDKSEKEKLKWLLVSGVILLVIGIGLSFYTPIIKRISTSSFVIVSGGISILVFALCYWVYDILNKKSLLWFFSIVGLNPLFIYLFAHVGGAELLHKIFTPFVGIFTYFMPEWLGGILTGLVVLAALWYLCYWLYKQKIFIRI
ncbi:MAG: DUF5009 domain-containing protein [Saprospiraceae bacterium]|nr:DUF5009 domain-containing protein [Saprospiraceae bacterium]